MNMKTCHVIEGVNYFYILIFVIGGLCWYCSCSWWWWWW
ncbi:hypothetical protein E2C01_037104 [Portunus trituberculatus]|uniref:Transmembrane protein n=1 Tax=Portunus trituberculatus TaxID=210409 RepID=A0A5B7FDR3_PORTR|nr:hypothetical protein [Portunus trituberculatus]